MKPEVMPKDEYRALFYENKGEAYVVGSEKFSAERQ
jgi:hypothetical protein